MNKQKACEAIHNLGGCDAAEEWSKGYDAGITAALDAIEKIPDTDNNADLISRSELQQEIAKGVGECRIRAFEPSVNCILQIIHRLPSADVQPVKHGKWIDIYEYCKAHDLRPSGLEVYYWCSKCDKAEKKTSDFCPNCGARMDGDTE
jgi:hypothetical protein